ncbi:hypothetical protein TOI97_11700 [Denitrificimonas sp. JX-1]|uniref:Uncharacterized protein n=1 Tax=Denitrificimonas halotolerans TaxID=3098930 RepID=A0ABU5GTB6_9GAMM|nr:hypothetical protein [Denitrificimonas sp. JX-1]MDY7220226.1 hypothetical protein [Denitrificimonas sp. JX-1]
MSWIPINASAGAVQWKNGQIYHNGHYFKVWDSYGLSQYKFRPGSFGEDARGCVVVACPNRGRKVSQDLK